MLTVCCLRRGLAEWSHSEGERPASPVSAQSYAPEGCLARANQPPTIPATWPMYQQCNRPQAEVLRPMGYGRGRRAPGNPVSRRILFASFRWAEWDRSFRMVRPDDHIIVLRTNPGEMILMRRSPSRTGQLVAKDETILGAKRILGDRHV